MASFKFLPVGDMASFIKKVYRNGTIAASPLTRGDAIDYL